VFGQAVRKAECYDNIRITKSAWDSTFCSVNPKFVAIITESAGGGAFLVLPLDKVGRIDRDVPLVSGHKAAVLDIAWCPHNDNVIASGSEDCTVKVWQIPDGGITTTLTQSSVDLVAHQRRVGQVLWHPSALNVLLSSGKFEWSFFILDYSRFRLIEGADMKIFIWNVGKSSILSTIDCHPEVILSVSWNFNGSRIVTSCKDKMFRVIDPRNGKVLQVNRWEEDYL
jgi:coronin-1B/1C/6